MAEELVSKGVASTKGSKYQQALHTETVFSTNANLMNYAKLGVKDYRRHVEDYDPETVQHPNVHEQLPCPRKEGAISAVHVPHQTTAVDIPPHAEG